MYKRPIVFEEIKSNENFRKKYSSAYNLFLIVLGPIIKNMFIIV